MATLKQLFDLQRFVENDALQEVIDNTHTRYSNAVIMDDRTLEEVVAGFGKVSAVEEKICAKCGNMQEVLMDSGTNEYICKSCGTLNTW